MTKKSDIQKEFPGLIEKFHAGKCSLAELYQLEKLFEGGEEAEEIKRMLYNQLEKGDFANASKTISPNTFGRIKADIQKDERQQNTPIINLLYSTVARFAAVILISFLLGGATVYLLSMDQEQKADYCEVIAPMGAKSQVILPDSSVVWMNAGSILKYSTNFNKSERDISLEGEAYFRVAKNKQLPFIVDAEGFLVEAVGTEFNVKAYKDESTIETILVEGKVRLDHKTETIADNVFLNPKYKATFYKDADEARRNNNQPRLVISPNVDPRPLIAWTEGRFIFVSELLEDLAHKLERKYNCTFMFESDDIKSYRFSGTLEDETLHQVMDVIARTSPISYKITGKKVIINKDTFRTKIFKKH